jgi:bacterial/archaeal transporter family protein
VSALLASLVAIFAKVGLQGVDVNVATTIRAFVMFIFLMVVISLQGKLKLIPEFLTSKIAFFIILSGIVGALSWLFYFIALKQGKATSVAGIDRLSVVFVLVFAFVFLNEKITLKGTIGILFIAIGAILIAIEN